MTKMCFLLRCQFFPLLVTDGSQCYYRSRLIFLMSQLNRLQNLTVAAHPWHTICTNKTFSKTKQQGKKKKLCCQTAPSSIKFHILELDIQMNNQRGTCIGRRDVENICIKNTVEAHNFLALIKFPQDTNVFTQHILIVFPPNSKKKHLSFSHRNVYQRVPHEGELPIQSLAM